jgi:hypothetical protein
MLNKRNRKRKFGKVTWDGRLVVNVDELYRSKQVQHSLNQLDRKIEKKREVPDSTTSYTHALTL